MTPQHDSYTLIRDIAACRAHVWAGWADPALKRRWFVDSDGPGWTTLRYNNDFRVGGRESGAFQGGEGPGKGLHENETTYLDIQDQSRLVFAYTMALNGSRHSASLVTVTLDDMNGGTRLTYTEQMTQLTPSDGIAGRKAGWTWLLSNLETALKETTA